MLPDYPEFKKECQDIVRDRLVQVRDGCVSPFGPNKNAANHFEGDKFELIRADGTGQPDSYRRVEHNWHFKIDELNCLTLEQLVAKYEKVGEEMGRQQFQIMIEALDQAVSGTPNEVSAGSKDLVEQIFESLEKIQIDFDPSGIPNQLQTIAAPSMAERLEAARERIQNDAILKRRYDELVIKKKEEWRDREAARKLVG